MKNPKQKIATFLMFSGNAEEAMNYYTSIFDRSEIINITRYGANEVYRLIHLVKNLVVLQINLEFRGN